MICVHGDYAELPERPKVLSLLETLESLCLFAGVEEPPRGLTITKRWLEGPQFQRTLQDLMDNRAQLSADKPFT